jgi:Peptidase A4 family
MRRPSRLFRSGTLSVGTLSVGVLVPSLAVLGSLLPISTASAEPAPAPVVMNGTGAHVVANTFVRGTDEARSGISGVTDSNFAGYIFFDAPTSVTATFKVPVLSCPAGGGYETSAGASLQGPSGSTINFENAYVYMFCENGAASYTGSFVTGSSSSPTLTPWTFTPAAGDKIKLKITTGTNFSDTAKDVTQATSSSVSGPCSSCGGSVGGVSMSIGPVPPFGSVDWTQVMVDGGTLAASDPDRYQDVNGSDLLIKTSRITGGTAFKNTFVASS